MRGGIWVLSIFGAVWGAAGVIVVHLPLALALLPLAISAAILFWASRQHMDALSPAEGKRVGRIVAVASAVEGVAIFITANVLINLHMPSAIMPAIAIIVGLHFLPLARGIPVPLYYKTGAALIALALLALLLAPAYRGFATGGGAALIMWASAIALGRFGRA